MKEASLSIVHDLQNHKYLMIKHHRGINKGFVNFPGGKKEPNENMTDCVIRETKEETGLVIRNPRKVGYIEFPNMDFYVHVFISTEFSGSLKENADEVDVFWQDDRDVPYEKMRDADRDFIAHILKGEYVKKRYFYAEDGHVEKVEEIA